MKSLQLLAMLAVLGLSINASLTLLSYDPLLFHLNFSSPAYRPTFQLLYNNIYDIPYTILTQNEPTNTFLLQARIDGLSQKSSLQAYDILFNTPLTVDGGELQVQSYTLQAEKRNVQTEFPAGFGIFILIAAYFFNTITEIGKLSIEFIHIYILFMFQSTMATSLYRELYVGMLLLPSAKILIEESFDTQTYVLTCLLLPIAILFAIGLLGFIVYKHGHSKEKSIFQNIIYEELVFNAFFKATHIFLFNLLFNTLQFLRYQQESSFSFLEEIKGIGFAAVYFNFVTLIAILYLVLSVVNPKVGQKQESWMKYLKSDQFMSFRNIHERLKLSEWYRRNYCLFKMVKHCLLIGFYFCGDSFQYTVLLFEFGHLFYTFTVRPFKEEFYLNVKVIYRLLFFTQYVFIVLGVVYYSIAQSTYNYYTARKFITARDSIFLVVIFVLFIGVFFEIYFKCDNLNYRIKLSREANQFKLEFVRKAPTDSDSRDKYKVKKLTVSERSKSDSRPFDFLSDPAVSPNKNDRNQARHQEEQVTRSKSKTNTEADVGEKQKGYHKKNSGSLMEQDRRAEGMMKREKLL